MKLVTNNGKEIKIENIKVMELEHSHIVVIYSDVIDKVAIDNITNFFHPNKVFVTNSESEILLLKKINNME